MKREDALRLIHKMLDAASKGGSALNIGPAMIHDGDDTAPVAMLADVLAGTGVNANLIVADDQGIHWRAVQQAAKLIKAVSERSPHGDGNFNFGAIAMVKPYGPYYPGSYHLGQGHAFAIAMEGANVVADVFGRYQDPREAEQHLTDAFAQDVYKRQVMRTLFRKRHDAIRRTGEVAARSRQTKQPTELIT